LRKLALQYLERIRKFKLSLAVYVFSMLVLTPVWIVTQYERADGWPEHLSTRSRCAGDWDPWIIWVALIGAFVVAIFAFRAYFERASTEGGSSRRSSGSNQSADGTLHWCHDKGRRAALSYRSR
jgi:hypothetical protein